MRCAFWRQTGSGFEPAPRYTVLLMDALLPFQEVGARFLANRRRAILADSMRVGKTPQAATACDLVSAERILILCPAIARPNWLREMERWTVAGRQGRAVVKAKDAIDPRLTVCSYDNLINAKVRSRVETNPWDVVIADEFHYLKSLSTARSAAAYALVEQTPYAWLLSGTPAPNDFSELWAPLSKLGITALSYWDFLKRYCTYWMHPVHGARVTGNQNVEELRALLAPHMLRRTLADVAPEMPPIRWSQVVVEPGPISDAYAPPDYIERARAEEARLAEALGAAQGQLESLDPEEAKHFRRLVGLQKVQPLAELIAAELDADMDRIVIFAWHTHVIGGLRAALDRFGALAIDGSTSSAKREAAQQAFSAGSCRVLICQIITAGTAIDLSSADDALFAECDWTPANNQQAAMRCVSQFKRRPVRVRFAAVAGSVDERVMRTSQDKSARLAEIFI